MKSKPFRVIDPVATGANIVRLRKERGLSVRDLQTYFGFEEPRAIYKWQCGQSLPTVDNLYALGALLEVSMEEILVQARPELNIRSCEQRAEAACCSPFFSEHPRCWYYDTAEIFRCHGTVSSMLGDKKEEAHSCAPPQQVFYFREYR